MGGRKPTGVADGGFVQRVGTQKPVAEGRGVTQDASVGRSPLRSIFFVPLLFLASACQLSTEHIDGESGKDAEERTARPVRSFSSWDRDFSWEGLQAEWTEKAKREGYPNSQARESARASEERGISPCQCLQPWWMVPPGDNWDI